MINTSFRTRVIFSDQKQIVIPDHKAADNFLWETKEESLTWIQKTTSLIGDFRAALRSVYIRWAITINALCLAKEHYEKMPDSYLRVRTIRSENNNHQLSVMASWPGNIAAQNYEACIPLISGYALQDLHGVLEEIIFKIYLVFLEGNPKVLMKGEEFRHLLFLFKKKDNSPQENEEFSKEFQLRLIKWKKNKSREGLYKIFRSYWMQANLENPEGCIGVDFIDILSMSINFISEIRNSITHGENNVSQELEKLSRDCLHINIEYVAGEPLVFSLNHLMYIEQFLNQFLTTLNLSLFELGVRKEKEIRVNAEVPSHTPAPATDKRHKALPA